MIASATPSRVFLHSDKPHRQMGIAPSTQNDLEHIWPKRLWGYPVVYSKVTYIFSSMVYSDIVLTVICVKRLIRMAQHFAIEICQNLLNDICIHTFTTCLVDAEKISVSGNARSCVISRTVVHFFSQICDQVFRSLKRYCWQMEQYFLHMKNLVK